MCLIILILSLHYQDNRAPLSGMTLGDNLSSQGGSPPPPPPPTLPSPSQRSPVKKKRDRKKSIPNVGSGLSAVATNGTVAASQVVVVDMSVDSDVEMEIETIMSSGISSKEEKKKKKVMSNNVGIGRISSNFDAPASRVTERQKGTYGKSLYIYMSHVMC